MIPARVVFATRTTISAGDGESGTGDTGCPHDSQGRCTVHSMLESVSFDVARQDQEVVELPLLLPRWQAVQLEAVANRRGMTTGQMLRRVISEMLATQSGTRS